MRRNLSTALLVIITVACARTDATQDDAEKAAAPSADAASARQAIEGAKQQLMAAFKAGDGAAAAAIYAPDALIMAPNEPIMRGAAIGAGLRGMFEQVAVPAIALTIADFTVSGDFAFENGTYEWTIQPKAAGAPPMPDKGKYLVVWQRQPDGSWKIVRDIWNTDTPAQH